MFGVSCPGCGLTRSLIHLAHGRWRESFETHRLGWFLALAVLLQFPYRLLGLRHPNHMPLGRYVPVWFGHTLILLLIVNWILLVGR
ncbi:MAG: DUF2752 domain-containing protein [Pirellulales bacterium]|nr:DUF2752 domain-containing protein [Pirellulales bacterium]